MLMESSSSLPAQPTPVTQAATETFYQTPPKTYGPYVLSGWWRRAGAAVIDGLIVGAAAAVVMLFFGTVFSVGFLAGGEAGFASVTLGLVIGALSVTLASLLYAPIVMARAGARNGQTLGKQACGIRVVRTNGQPLDFGWAALREVVIKWLLFGVVGASVTAGLAQILDLIWPLWDSENRALHDHLAQTRVVVA